MQLIKKQTEKKKKIMESLCTFVEEKSRLAHLSNLILSSFTSRWLCRNDREKERLMSMARCSIGRELIATDYPQTKKKNKEKKTFLFGGVDVSPSSISPLLILYDH